MTLVKNLLLSVVLSNPFSPAACEANEAVTRKPPPLKRGDTVGLLAPASPLDLPLIQAAEDNLRRKGYRVKRAKGVESKVGYLAGNDAMRAEALNEFLVDSEVKAIICLRGGYGTPRLLDRVDYEAMRNHPKILVGYSDITALLLAARQKAGLVVFHGPMGKEWSHKGALTPFSEKYYWSAFGPTSPLFEDWGGQRTSGVKKPFLINGGKAEGILVGGNLSVICALMGTPYEIDTRGAILFLEDVKEKLFRIDRMLNQLRLAGKLKQTRGILLGAFTGCQEAEGTVTRREVFEDYFEPLQVPVLAGYPSGHVSDNVTLPLGVRVRLDATAGTLAILESPVAK